MRGWFSPTEIVPREVRCIVLCGQRFLQPGSIAPLPSIDNHFAFVCQFHRVSNQLPSVIRLQFEAGQIRRHEEDVDGDGDLDLVFHFRMGETGLGCGSAGGTLFGETFDGPTIIGTDAILMLDKGGGKP